MAEQKAHEAATATADKAAAEEERVAAVEERAAAANESRICQTEFIVELAVLCDCVSELEEVEEPRVLAVRQLVRYAEGPVFTGSQPQPADGGASRAREADVAAETVAEPQPADGGAGRAREADVAGEARPLLQQADVGAG